MIFWHWLKAEHMTCIYLHAYSLLENKRTTYKCPFTLIYSLECLWIPALPNADFLTFPHALTNLDLSALSLTSFLYLCSPKQAWKMTSKITSSAAKRHLMPFIIAVIHLRVRHGSAAHLSCRNSAADYDRFLLDWPLQLDTRCSKRSYPHTHTLISQIQPWTHKTEKKNVHFCSPFISFCWCVCEEGDIRPIVRPIEPLVPPETEQGLSETIVE